MLLNILCAHGRPYTKLLVVVLGVETLIQTEVTEVLPEKVPFNMRVEALETTMQSPEDRAWYTGDPRRGSVPRIKQALESDFLGLESCLLFS